MRERVESDGLAFRRFRHMEAVDFPARRFPPPAEADAADEHGQPTGAVMRHQQHPLLSVVISPEPQNDSDAEREALEELQAVLDRHLSRLPASSEWRPAFVKMSLAASRSLERQPLRLLQRQLG